MREPMAVKRVTTNRDARRVHSLASSLMLTAATMGLVMVPGSPSYAQALRSYDIPAGPLADVLNAYARQAGIELA